MKTKLLILTLLLLLCGTGFAQKVGTTSFQFLKVIPGARSTAMGEAFVAPANGAEALYWNPAGIVTVENLDVYMSHIDWFVDTKLYSMNVAYNLGSFGVIGFTGMYTDYGSIQVTTVEALGFNADGTFYPGYTGETLSPYSLVVGLSYARSLTDKFSFGFTVKYAAEDLGKESASAVVFDGGLVYDTGFRSIRLGAAVRQFGPDVTYVKEGYPLPQTFEVGVSAYLFAPSNPLITEVEGSSLLFSYSIVHPRDYDQQQVLGLEYAWDDLFFVRGGYKLNFDEETYSAGLGVKSSGFRFDYSYMPYGDFLDTVHRLSLGYSLD